MNILNAGKLWAYAGILAKPSPEERIKTLASSRTKLSSDVPQYSDFGNAGLAFKSLQQRLFEPERELEDWQEQDLEALLYEMSTEADPNA